MNWRTILRLFTISLSLVPSLSLTCWPFPLCFVGQEVENNRSRKRKKVSKIQKTLRLRFFFLIRLLLENCSIAPLKIFFERTPRANKTQRKKVNKIKKSKDSEIFSYKASFGKLLHNNTKFFERTPRDKTKEKKVNNVRKPEELEIIFR